MATEIEQDLDDLTDAISDFCTVLIDYLFPDAEKAPWDELNKAYVDSKGTFDGTQFAGPKGRKARALFCLQYAADQIGANVEGEDNGADT